MEGKWELADDDKTVVVEPGKGVVAYFRYAKDAEMAVKAPAMAEALEKACRNADEGLEHGDPYPIWYEEARALLTAIKGE